MFCWGSWVVVPAAELVTSFLTGEIAFRAVSWIDLGDATCDSPAVLFKAVAVSGMGTAMSRSSCMGSSSAMGVRG